MNDQADAQDSFMTAQSNLPPAGGETHGQAAGPAVYDAAEARKIAAIEKLIATIEAEDLEYGRASPPPPFSGHTASDRLSPATGPPHLPRAAEEEGEPAFSTRPFAHPMSPGETATSAHPRAPAEPPTHMDQPSQAFPSREAPNGHPDYLPTGPNDHSAEGNRTEGAYIGVVPGHGSDARHPPTETVGGAGTQHTTPTLPSAEAEHHIVKDARERASDEKTGDALRCRCSRSTALTVAFVLVLALALLMVVMAVLDYLRLRDRPLVSGRFGAVRGQRLVVKDQGRELTVDAFLGLPFAKLPGGQLRFNPPQPLDSPLGKDGGQKPLDSNHKRPPCPQHDFYLGRDVVSTSNASEDCLHLNIWAPPSNCTTGIEPGPCDRWPVLFFLYGAAFQNGGNSFDLYDGRYLAALGNLVVVVPNYRVGALGFLCGPTQKGIPGNAGLQDQRLAFEWTLANIVSFGGDTSQMVLAGHDAGASSLGYHLFYGDVAFWTRNVTRFILQSGGPYHRYESQGMEGARRLAESLHCSPSNLSTDRAVSCLQDADVGAVARNPLALNFGPVFNRAPLSMPIEAHNGQAVSGTKRRHVEGSEFLLGRAASEGVYTWYVAQHRSASGDLRRLAARLLGDEVLERWQTATGITLDADSPVAVYQQAVGDVLEACPMSELAERLKAWQNRVYVYVLGYQPSYSSWTDQNETVHFEDVELVFGKPLRHGVSSNDEDKKWSRTMIDIWATFARTGRAPRVGNAKWSLYDSAHPKIMKFGPKEIGEQDDDKSQECAIVRSGPSTTPTGHHGNTTVPHAGAARAGTTSCGYGIAVAALVWANVALRA